MIGKCSTRLQLDLTALLVHCARDLGQRLSDLTSRNYKSDFEQSLLLYTFELIIT